MTTGVALDPVPLLLHAVGAAVLALVGVGAARWLGVARDLTTERVDRLGWALGVAAVALGGLAYAALAAPVDLATVDRGFTVYEGSYAPLELGAPPVSTYGGASPWLVLLGVPMLSVAWAAAAVRGARSAPVGASPPRVLLQAAGVWLVTLPLQAALCAWDVEGGLVLLGAAVALVGVAATATGRSTATDLGDVLAAVGAWLVAAASWPGVWSYAAPVVVAVLVVVRRRSPA